MGFPVSGYIGKTTNLQRDVMRTQTQAERLDQWGEINGEVKSFDPATQTATIQPLYKPRHNGQPIDMPELLEVPVRFARAGDGALTFPIGPGTKVVLRPSMRSNQNYHTENNGEASDARSFNLSDMEAHLDGGESLQDPIKGFDADNTHLRLDPEGQYGFKGSKDGKIALIGSEGNIYDLIAEATGLCADGFELLGEESLIHQAEYANIGDQLRDIYDKLKAMAL